MIKNAKSRRLFTNLFLLMVPSLSVGLENLLMKKLLTEILKLLYKPMPTRMQIT